MEDAACHHKTAALPTSWRQLQNLKEFRAKRAAAAGCQNKSCFNTACYEEILSNEKLRQKRSRSKEPRPKVQKGKHQAHCSTASSWLFKNFLRKLLWLETNHWSRQTRVVLEVSVPCQHQCHQCLQFLSDQLQNRSLRTATDVFLLCSNVQKRSFPELR